MTPNDDLGRHLSTGLSGLAGSSSPDYLDDILTRSVRTRQRRAWPFASRPLYPDGVPHLRAGWLVGRFLHMTPMVRLGLVAAVSLALGVAVAPLLGSAPSGVVQVVASPPPDASPAASAGPDMSAAWFTGMLVQGSLQGTPTTTVKDDVQQDRGYEAVDLIFRTDDPRFNGTASSRWNQDSYAVPGAQKVNVQVNTYQIVNDRSTNPLGSTEGTWDCQGTSLVASSASTVTSANGEDSICTGGGDYAGLSAIMFIEDPGGRSKVSGAIFPGDLPPSP